jgi:outer membrane protein OmpA-like peptidoglycan-associated protein
MSDEKLYSLELARRFANEVLTNVTFAFNSAELDQGARDIIQEQATWIMQFPELRFRIYGHADSPGSNAYNKRLGLKRARAVMAYMVSLGIEHSRLEALASVGETQPLIVSTERERRNRRVVTEVTGFVARHPTVVNGEFARIAYREYIKQGTGGGTDLASTNGSAILGQE